MKQCVAVGFILFFGVATLAKAQVCGEESGHTLRLTDKYTDPNRRITDTLSNMRIVATSPGGEEWKEDHCASGALYKVGAGTPVDPRAFRGTWSVAATRAVRYDYTVGGSASYRWSLWKNDAGGLCWSEESRPYNMIATSPPPVPIPGGSECSVP